MPLLFPRTTLTVIFTRRVTGPRLPETRGEWPGDLREASGSTHSEDASGERAGGLSLGHSTAPAPLEESSEDIPPGQKCPAPRALEESVHGASDDSVVGGVLTEVGCAQQNAGAERADILRQAPDTGDGVALEEVAAVTQASVLSSSCDTGLAAVVPEVGLEVTSVPRSGELREASPAHRAGLSDGGLPHQCPEASRPQTPGPGIRAEPEDSRPWCAALLQTSQSCSAGEASEMQPRVTGPSLDDSSGAAASLDILEPLQANWKAGVHHAHDVSTECRQEAGNPEVADDDLEQSTFDDTICAETGPQQRRPGRKEEPRV